RRGLQSAGHPGLRRVPGVVRLEKLPPRLRQLPHAVAHAPRLVVPGHPDRRGLRLPVRDRAARQRHPLRVRDPGPAEGAPGGGGGTASVILEPGWIVFIMAVLFLGLGYIGVPVPFALMAGVFVGTALTPVSMQSIVGQLFNGLDAEALLAVPFFLLVGELMSSADVTRRMIHLAQALGGHLRGGPAHGAPRVSTCF